MPTGYTSQITDGINFEDFVMSCARAFSALITMRDDPSSKPIPKKFKPSSWHKVELVKTEKELVAVKAMSLQKATEKAKKEYQTELDTKEKGIRKANEIREQYQAMLIKVKQWQPPTPDHQGLKDFMIDQIEGSIKFDCGTSYYTDQQIKLLTGQEWKEKRLQGLQKDLAYHKEKYLEEVEGVAGRNDWVQKLRVSLK